MSRTQLQTLAVLGVALVLVYGSLGAYGLIRLTKPVRVQSAGPVQVAATPALAASPSSFQGGSPAPTLIPLVSPAVIAPTATPPSSPPDAPHATETPHPTPADGAGPTPPTQATSTTQPSPAPPTPPAPAPSPTPDTRCVDTENAHHQQMLADIEAQYEPMLSWLADEMEQAQRDQDEMRIQDLQLELEMYENMKAADIDAEIARHQEALAACGS